MKKKVVCILMTAGLLLLISCGRNSGVGPIRVTDNGNTPTPIIVPTCTPTASPTPDPAKIPSATPTAEAQPAETAMPEPTATPEPTKEPTATLEPTVTPEPTQKPTEAPDLTKIPSATPTVEAQPTETATPEPTATPAPSPTPAINPETFVNYGWQKTVSIDEKYVIIFPEIFRESVVTRNDRELLLTYCSEENTEITFCISYTMNRTLEDAVSDVLAAEGSVLEGTVSNRKVLCRWQEGSTMYRGVLVEGQYPQSLLGDVFGEEEWITGIMQVVFSYPADRYAEYEITEYNYYVIENREE